jgi:hypothetical protein
MKMKIKRRTGETAPDGACPSILDCKLPAEVWGRSIFRRDAVANTEQAQLILEFIQEIQHIAQSICNCHYPLLVAFALFTSTARVPLLVETRETQSATLPAVYPSPTTKSLAKLNPIHERRRAEEKNTFVKSQ